MTSKATRQHPQFPFRQLDPVPPQDELSDFYESKYYDAMRNGTRAPELARLMAGGDAATRERNWLTETLFSDVADGLTALTSERRLLDIGCGNGELLLHLCERGFEAEGIEPAQQAVAAATERGLKVHGTTLEKFVAEHQGPPFAIATLMNVLEHVPDPVATMGHVRQLLAPGGIAVVRVPNDFNPLQDAALNQIGGDPWWVARPDHINYFSFATLAQTLDKLGFDVVREMTDFPMELFLLLGFDYVRERPLGPECHNRRIAFEKSLGTETRRRLYDSFAKAGFGRNALTFARRRG